MDIAVIGAGPAGLIAAEKLASAGYGVCVFERKTMPARKFLLAGRGGLNLTHSEPLETFLTRYRERQDFLEPMIRAFTPDDLRVWCEGLGQETFIGSSGRVFPKVMKASPLLRAWLARLNDLGVEFRMGHEWQGWDDKGRLSFRTKDDVESAAPKATLLALGGASWPELGADGSWQKILRDKGVTSSPLKPANCGFASAWSDIFKNRFAGRPLKSIALTCRDETVKGEIMIDANGIEGNAVYALSATIRKEIEANGHTDISIDLRPAMDHAAIMEKLKIPRGRKSFSTWMEKSLKLSPVQISLLREASPDVSNLPLEALAELIKSVPLRLTSSFSIARAISSAGGITPDNLNEHLMLCKMPGVFMAGEMLDWEAPTGGYLLQSCFATGVAAASGIEKYLSS